MSFKSSYKKILKPQNTIHKMQEYYFLFIIAFLWTLVATIQDLKKREVANWLNFSLVAIALAYRAFYSLQTKNPQFFLLGVAGALVCFGLANAFYYGRVFAGGDAKLLIGFGAILPFTSFKLLIPETLLFIVVLFFVGAIYSLLFSISLVLKNKNRFKKEFLNKFSSVKIPTIIVVLGGLVLLIIPQTRIIASIAGFLALFIILFMYTKSLEVCMVKRVEPTKLTEGDWILGDIRINKNMIIKKTVHGLSLSDIKKLRKANKAVLVKEGIPFVPSFLIALLVMVYASVILQSSLLDLFVHFLPV
jgi:Flp pilus assembly protein protease CpaA